MVLLISAVMSFIGGVLVARAVNEAYPEKTSLGRLLHSLLIIVLFWVAFTADRW